MISSSEKTVRVFFTPHPFLPGHAAAEASTGENIAEIVCRLASTTAAFARDYAHVHLNGRYIARADWDTTCVAAGDHVAIRLLPQGGGGGGKNPLRTVLSLAIMAASPVLSGTLSGFFGATAARFVTAGVNLVSRLALNALAPPPKARFAKNPKESPTLFIQGARNQAQPFGRVPKVLGRHRFVPPLAAFPYTETVGNDQYLRMLFVWGYGPLQISDLKIGETDLADFDGVEVETRAGYEDDAPIRLYTNAVLQNDLQINARATDGYIVRTSEADADEISVDITLPRGLFRFNASNQKVSSTVQVEVQYAPTGTSNWSAPATSFMAVPAQDTPEMARPAAYVSGGVTYRTIRIDRVVLDPASGTLKVVAGNIFREGVDAGSALPSAIPAGYHALAKVERRSDDTAAIIAARIMDERNAAFAGDVYEDAGDFLPAAGLLDNRISVAAGGLKFKGLYLTAKQSSAIRKTVSFKVPQGQYDVRVRRLTPDATSDNVFDETAWTALRTVRYAAPVRMAGIALTALRIKATDQLSGVIDRFNGVVQSIVPDWNGSAWVAQATSNPASLYRHVLQGAGNARPLADSRIDLDGLAAWHERNRVSNRQFNAVIDFDVSLREVLEDVAACGRASPALSGGKWSVIEDRASATPVQHFTPRNTFAFQGRKSFAELPQALRVRFINAKKGYLQDERLVFDDGFTAETASQYETLELTGVTDPDQAWKDGRYHIATARLRPETFIFNADLEHIVCTRGDLVLLTHDVPLIGLQSARVSGVTLSGGDAVAVTLDAAVEMQEGRDYAVRFRKPDGTSVVASVVTVAGITKTLGFSDPLSAYPAAGDLAVFGESGAESAEMVVKSIEPQGNLAAKITCVAAAPAVHAADSGDIPDFTSGITLPPELQLPPAPVLSGVQSGEEVLIRHTDGSLTARIVVTLFPASHPRPLAIEAFIRAKDETDFRPAVVLSQSASEISLTDVTEGEIYDIRLRYVAQETGIRSPALLIAAHQVTGATADPSDVDGFTMRVYGDTAHFSWMAVTDVDLSHYRLRYTPLVSGAMWSSAVDVIEKIAMDATSVSLPAASGSYLIKAVDAGGRESVAAAVVVSTISATSGFNAVLAIDEDPVFAGEKQGIAACDGILQLEGDSVTDDWADIDVIDNVDVGSGLLLASGTYEFGDVADLGAVYTSRLTATMAVSGIDLSLTVDICVAFDDIEDIDQDTDPGDWLTRIEVATTNDDPAGSPVWSGWTPFVVGDYTARAFRFRVVMESYAVNVTPALSDLGVVIDMPDRTVSARDIVSLAAGSTVAFDRAFRAVPAVSITAHDMATGDYFTLTGTTASGFDIRFFNSSGSGIVRIFDYFARGYGEENLI